MGAGGWRVTGFLALATAILVGGCTQAMKQQAPKVDRLPVVDKIELAPDGAQPGDSIYARIEITDLDRDAFTAEYQWFVNGEVQAGATADSISTEGLGPGAEVYVKVRPRQSKDGKFGDWKTSGKLALGEDKASLVKGVSIVPQTVTRAAPAKAVVDYGDLPERMVRQISYRWFVNEQAVEGDGTTDALSPKFYKRGDELRVEISTDGSFAAPSLWKSRIYPVINASPTFADAPAIAVEGNTATISFPAADADGDTLTYSIRDAPPGTTIPDINQGLAIVNFTQARPGTYEVVFGAKDGHGGEVYYTSTVEMPKSAPPE